MIIKDIFGKYKLVDRDRVFFKPCIICGGAGQEEHHCIPNRAYKPLCTQYGLTVMLCKRCHDLAHYKPVASGIYYKIKRIAQKVFEECIGTHKEWMSIFHKDYIADEQ